MPPVRQSESASETLERCGRCYGELHLAIAFTISQAAPLEFKQCKFWKDTKQLPSGDYGSAYVTGRGRTKNPAVVLAASGLVGIDIDGQEGRDLARRLAPGQWPPTVAVRSGRPDVGLHMWYRAPKGTLNHKVQLAHSLMLSRDGYFICPPALHTLAGKPYTFLPGRAPWEIEIALLPDWLQEKLTDERSEREQQLRHDDSSPITEGERHFHLLRVAGAMRHAGAGEPAILAALLSENARRCMPPKDDAVVRALAHDIATRYPPGA